MTRDETRQIMRMLQAAYPSRYRGLSKADVEKLLDQWTLPEPFIMVKSAVQAAINTMKFHPSIAEIKTLMNVAPIVEVDDMRAAFKSMLRFRISQLKAQIKPPEKLETEAERQRSAEAQQKLTALYERYKDLLEGGTE